MNDHYALNWIQVRGRIDELYDRSPPDRDIQIAEALLGFRESSDNPLPERDERLLLMINKEYEPIFIELAELNEYVRLATNATSEIERLTTQVMVLRKIMWIRDSFVPNPFVALKAELLLHRYLLENRSVCEPGRYLQVMVRRLLALLDEEGTTAIKGITNRRTASYPRKPPADLAGYYWGSDGKLQYDGTQKNPLKLVCTRENALAIMEFFERTQGKKRGAKSFAMEKLGIKDSRTFDRLPSKSGR